MDYLNNAICHICNNPTIELPGIPGHSFCSTACLEQFAWRQLVSVRDLLVGHLANYPQGNGFTVAIFQRVLAEMSQVLVPLHTDDSDLSDIGQRSPDIADQIDAEPQPADVVDAEHTRKFWSGNLDDLPELI